MSTETEREILHILEDAIKREQSAQQLYKRGADLASDQEVKRVFTAIAAEEVKHEQLLRDIYYGYKKKLGLKILKSDEE